MNDIDTKILKELLTTKELLAIYKETTDTHNISILEYDEKRLLLELMRIKGLFQFSVN